MLIEKKFGSVPYQAVSGRSKLKALMSLWLFCALSCFLYFPACYYTSGILYFVTQTALANIYIAYKYNRLQREEEPFLIGPIDDYVCYVLHLCALPYAYVFYGLYERFSEVSITQKMEKDVFMGLFQSLAAAYPNFDFLQRALSEGRQGYAVITIAASTTVLVLFAIGNGFLTSSFATKFLTSESSKAIYLLITGSFVVAAIGLAISPEFEDIWRGTHNRFVRRDLKVIAYWWPLLSIPFWLLSTTVVAYLKILLQRDHEDDPCSTNG